MYRDLFLCLAFLACLIVYLSTKVDWEDFLQKDSPTPIHLNGKIAPRPKSLPDVKMISLPKELYDDKSSDSWTRYITGNQKYVLALPFGGKPASSFAVKKELRNLFNKKGYREYYRKHVVNLGASWYVSCPISAVKSCPKLWLHQQCAAKLCIINPKAKKIIIDGSGDMKQAEELLKKYQDW